LRESVRRRVPGTYIRRWRTNLGLTYAQVAEELGERPSTKQMGLVMKAATAIAEGKADGARLSAAVKERL
jgi:uncharacterized protein YqeY